MAACGMKYIDLRNEAIKILGAYFPYNQKIKHNKNFYNISNKQGVLNLCRMRNLSLEGRIVELNVGNIENSLSSSFNQSPHQVVKELEKIQKSFLWKDSTPKIRHEITCRDYKDSGLKNVDISYKVVSLQCSWIRRLNDFHEWKLIPLHFNSTVI